MKSLKPPTNKLFMTISILALIWYLFGDFIYFSQFFIIDLSEENLKYYNHIPLWATSALALSILAGTLGCLALVLKNKNAKLLLTLSFIAVIIRVSYDIFIQNDIVLPSFFIITHIIVLSISFFLVWFSRFSASKNWIS